MVINKETKLAWCKMNNEFVYPRIRIIVEPTERVTKLNGGININFTTLVTVTADDGEIYLVYVFDDHINDGVDNCLKRFHSYCLKIMERYKVIPDNDVKLSEVFKVRIAYQAKN